MDANNRRDRARGNNRPLSCASLRCTGIAREASAQRAPCPREKIFFHTFFDLSRFCARDRLVRFDDHRSSSHSFPWNGGILRVSRRARRDFVVQRRNPTIRYAMMTYLSTSRRACTVLLSHTVCSRVYTYRYMCRYALAL